MDPSLLQQFRQQLAAWIEARLESQRLPFQRLELCPSILTDQGRLTPDMVLWINRDSQLAGSMILLPDTVDATLLAEAASLAKALGLGHFTTWAARKVSIWTLASGSLALQHDFLLPPATRVTPDDFQQVLGNLFERLKVVTVTSAPTTAEYSVHYFANLCLRNLQELAPGLTISARLAAGQTAADNWLAQAPREKAWLSLWRILFLLWSGRLPPALQPERLELAIHYALAELNNGQPSRLSIQNSEPPLPEGDAVRLHHLATRLRQLGWPHSNQQAEELICLLLREVGPHFNLEPQSLPWATDHTERWMGCQPPPSIDRCALIAPRAYLAGWALKSSMQQGQGGPAFTHAESLQALDATQECTSAIAVLRDTQPLDRKEHDTRLILLRQVWPSRRFDLPRHTPAWLWDALYLAGLTSAELSLTLPQNWYCTPGISSLWTTLGERYQLADLNESETGEQSLHFIQAPPRRATALIHRPDQTIEVAQELLIEQAPGTTQVWLKASEKVIELLHSQKLSGADSLGSGWSESLTWGAFLFLQTRLGRYLWELCSGHKASPEFSTTAAAVEASGVPIPNETILTDLSLTGALGTRAVPAPELLEQEFANIFGDVPPVPEDPAPVATDAARPRRRRRAPTEQIAARVFTDGIPRFPEHYLMGVYRPKLVEFDLNGPLEMGGEFFDRISLQTIGESPRLEVSGRVTAEALILASYTDKTRISLPAEEDLLAELVVHYRSDLQQLWSKLIRECRRSEPRLHAAIKMARKIWQHHGLPPESVFRGT